MLLLFYITILILERIQINLYFYMDIDLHFPSLKSWRVYISMHKQFSVSDLWRVPVLNVHFLYLNLHDGQYLNEHCIRKFKAVSQFTQEPKTILTGYV